MFPAKLFGALIGLGVCVIATHTPAMAAATSYPLTLQNCGVAVTFDKAPQRVVALGQNTAEILLLLGLDDRMVGTAFWPTKVLPELEEANSKVKLLVFRGNAAEPHDVVLTRERQTGADVVSRMANPTTGYVRILEFSKDTATRVKLAVDTLAKTGAIRCVVDIRGTAKGDLEDGIAVARLFVKTGTLAVRSAKAQQETVTATEADGAITLPVALLVSQGTSGAAEVFAAALDGNGRADLVGEHTLGRVARQRLVKLPDGSGLLISTQRYLTPKSAPLHERGLAPDVAVEEPDVEFGAAPPPGDKALDAAVARLAKPAA